MSALPPRLVEGLSAVDREAVTAWWAGLSAGARSEVVALCDARRDDCFFGAVPEEGAPVPRVLGGRFVPRDDAAGWAEWHAECFDYLLCHPELVFVAPPVVRTFHVCTRHESARAVLEAGHIPADFLCPLRSEDCPMRRLLGVALGRSVRLIALGLAPELLARRRRGG